MIDPEAVRKALAEIDEKTAIYDEVARNVPGVSDESLIAYKAMRESWAMNAISLVAAARAWLEQQETNDA